jgi:3-hydroxyisobutyrate dehydrogenase
MIAPSNTKIAWTGTRVMGLSMCGHLIHAGYRLTVHSRTKTKAQPLLDRGADWAESPQVLAGAVKLVVTMVGFPADVRDVYFGPSGIFAGVRPRTILIDMTTTLPTLSREIAERTAAIDCSVIDDPVSGGDSGARNATLSIMVRGTKQDVQTVMPLLERLGKTIVYQGEAGSGQHAKLRNQIVIAGTMVGVCESLLFGYKAGLDLDWMLHSISGGAAACWTLTNRAPRIL